MKLFFKKVVLFLLIFLFLNVVVSGLLKFSIKNSYSNGNELFSYKLKILSEKKETNTLFVGSSRYYRHFIPHIFDSLNNNSIFHLETHSFNLGVPGLNSPESLYLLDNLIADDNQDIDFIFFSPTGIMEIEKENIFSERMSYFLSPKILFLTANIIRKECSNNLGKIQKIAPYLLNGLYNYGSSLFLRNLFNNEQIKFSKEQQLRIADGFISLDIESDSNIIKRRLHLVQDTNALSRRRHKGLLENNFESNCNSSQYNIFKQLSEKCHSRGINLVYLIPPRTLDFKIANWIVENIPSCQVINLSDPASFSEFYEFRHSFDIGHLNQKGARLATFALHNKFKGLLNADCYK